MNQEKPRPYVRGIDVSIYQKVIDWKRVAKDEQGIDFAFIRLSDGLRRDKMFETNWTGARSAGLITGIYQYFDVHQSVSAQVDMVLEAMGDPLAWSDGMTLPPALDVEAYEDSRKMPSPREMVSAIYAWCSAIEAALGIPPVIYTNASTWDTYVRSLGFHQKHPLWVAHYTEAPAPLVPQGWKQHGLDGNDWTFWQYTNRARVSGIGSLVDMNYFRGSKTTLKLFCERRC